jgi:hypothetical protein
MSRKKIGTTKRSYTRKVVRPIYPAWTDMNPWTDEYLERELQSMVGLPPYQTEKLSLEYTRVQGVVDCYMRQDFLDWGPFPVLRTPETLWMSMTPREIESQYMPIRMAEGVVGIGGLGLGYSTTRIASKPEVEKVIVYETDPKVIALFERNFGTVPKVDIRQEDIATLRGQSYDVFFADVYAKMWEDAELEHWNLLTDWNDIGWYHPWGIEAILMAYVVAQRKNEIPYSWRYTCFDYLQQLLDATGKKGDHGVLDIHFGVPKIESAEEMTDQLRPDLWKDAA